MAFFAQLLASLSQMAMIMMVLYLLAQAGLLQSLMQFINPQQAQPGQRVLNNAQATARPGPQLPPAPSKSAGKKKKGKKSDDAGEQQVNALCWQGTAVLWCSRTQWFWCAWSSCSSCRATVPLGVKVWPLKCPAFEGACTAPIIKRAAVTTN